MGKPTFGSLVPWGREGRGKRGGAAVGSAESVNNRGLSKVLALSAGLLVYEKAVCWESFGLSVALASFFALINWKHTGHTFSVPCQAHGKWKNVEQMCAFQRNPRFPNSGAVGWGDSPFRSKI
jgi:hypothetical protein